jgi:alpha-beta hydrolase superfamily lysophospholipase
MTQDVLARPDNPAHTYDEARARFDAMLRTDPDAVDPLSRSRLETPGYRTERAIVFLHGLTNSPRQFVTLGERLIARGYTVFTPRMPYHGYLDRMNTDHSRLRAHELIDVVAASVDLAAGLADHVTVSGISLGGVLAVWAAQYRPVALAAPIAPAIGIPWLPVRATGPLFGALGRLPNRFVWWDPRHKEKLPGPPYAYPRFSTHALVQTQQLAVRLLDVARQAPPRAASICMISNAADLAVSNSASATLVKRWRASGAANVTTYQFPREMKLFHDLVDPLQPNSQPEVVLPILERLLAGDAPQRVSAEI